MIEGPMCITTDTCIIRKTDGTLAFVGDPMDGRAVAIDRWNNGERIPKDYDMMADLPVFDEDTLTNPTVKILPPRRRF